MNLKCFDDDDNDDVDNKDDRDRLWDVNDDKLENKTKNTDTYLIILHIFSLIFFLNLFDLKLYGKKLKVSVIKIEENKKNDYLKYIFKKTEKIKLYWIQ